MTFLSLCAPWHTTIKLLFKFATHNVKGLNSPLKRRMSFQHYKSLHVDVLLLQERHFTLNYNPNFLHHYYLHFYLENGPGKTGAVAICFSKRVSFSLEKKICDPEGRYLLLVGLLEGSPISLISYYAPNTGQLPFFFKLYCMLCPWTRGGWYLLQGIQTALDSIFDKTRRPSSSSRSYPKIGSKLAKILHYHNLIDVWWKLNPSSKDYTFFSNVHRTYSRIDHFFTNPEGVPLFRGSKIVDVTWSDHSLLWPLCNTLAVNKGPAPWRLNHF